MKVFIILLSVCSVVYGLVPKLDGRIVGGKEVEILQYPYQVSVRYYDQHICGGAILDEYTVVTASHCVHGMDHNQYAVRVGNKIHAQGEFHYVSEVRQHEDYDEYTTDYDVAILKLFTPLEFSDSVQPIPLQDANVEVPAGTKAWVSGWGDTAATRVSRLRAVDVEVVSIYTCTRSYGNAISERMLCAAAPNKDSCQGDSGGPLVANGKLIGVVSWGYGCAQPDFPGVYSNVANLRDWIESNK